MPRRWGAGGKTERTPSEACDADSAERRAGYVHAVLRRRANQAGPVSRHRLPVLSRERAYCAHRRSGGLRFHHAVVSAIAPAASRDRDRIDGRRRRSQQRPADPEHRQCKPHPHEKDCTLRRAAVSVFATVEFAGNNSFHFQTKMRIEKNSCTSCAALMQLLLDECAAMRDSAVSSEKFLVRSRCE